MIDNNFEELLKKIKIVKKDVNFFDIISPKETIVSEWLSFIFDPSINGVGNLTVNKLLEAVNIEYNLDELRFINIDTEVTTNKSQRMDIVIKYDGLWIIIENKIDSEETGNQTEEYYKYIESIKDNNEVIYIYLKPNYNKSIPKKSFDNNEGFRVLTYSELLKKLKQINEFDYYEKYKYKYLHEFLVSGDRFMKNEKLEYNEAVRFYINNKQKMEEIEREYKKQNRRLYEKIRYDLLSIINKSPNKYKTDDDKSIALRNYIQYYKDGWRNENHQGAHFELLFKDDKILSNNTKCDVVLHLEHNLTQEDLEKFKSKGITKNRSLAFDNKKNSSISYRIDLDFSSNANYEISLKKIAQTLQNLISEYENIIDEVLRYNV